MKRSLIALIVGGCMILMSCIPSSSSSLPACNSQEVVSNVNQILSKSLLAISGAIKNASVQSPAEKRYDSNTDTRVCHAVVETLFGPQRMVYTIEWHDKANGVFWIEMAGQNIPPFPYQ